MIQHPNIYINNTLQTSSQSSFISSKERVMRNPIPLTVDGCDVPVGYSSDQCHFMIIKHVDVVWLYKIKPELLPLINKLLIIMDFKLDEDVEIKNPKSVHKRQRQYSSDKDRTSIQILYQHRRNVSYPESMSIHIHDLSREFSHSFHELLNYHCIDYVVNHLELTFDFYSNCIVTMQGFLERHLYVCHRITGKSGTCNLPFRSKNGIFSRPMDNLKHHAMKIYLKKHNGMQFVRLELVMGRTAIRKRGFDLRLEGVDTINLSEYFKFKRLNEEKPTDYYAGKPSSPLLPTDDIKEKRRRMNEGGLFEREHFIDLVFKDPALLLKVAALKKMKFKNYNRFLTPFTEFQEIFDREIKKQTFLKPMDFSEWDFVYKPKVKLFRRH